VDGWLAGCRSLVQTAERFSTLAKNSSGQERAARTLTAILTADDVPAALESSLASLDADVLALARANAVSAREDRRPELAALMDSLGDYVAAWLTLSPTPDSSPDAGRTGAAVSGAESGGGLAVT
jgi:hypothetical protein